MADLRVHPSGKAMVKVAVDLVAEGKLTPREAVMRIDPAKLDEVLHPTIDPKARPAPMSFAAWTLK